MAKQEPLALASRTTAKGHRAVSLCSLVKGGNVPPDHFNKYTTQSTTMQEEKQKKLPVLIGNRQSAKGQQRHAKAMIIHHHNLRSIRMIAILIDRQSIIVSWDCTPKVNRAIVAIVVVVACINCQVLSFALRVFRVSHNVGIATIHDIRYRHRQRGVSTTADLHI